MSNLECFNAKKARELADKCNNDAVDTELNDIFSGIENLAIHGISSGNFYVDIMFTDNLVEKLESLGFVCAVESATPSEDLINIAW